MRENTCCFTGHRRIPQEKVEGLKVRLKRNILNLYAQGITDYCVGGALGFDSLAAEAVLQLRDNGYPRLRLILVLPCLNQTKGWKAEDIVRYDKIKDLADKTVYTSQEYTPGCMHKRNRHLVDHSSVCICFLERSKGGTEYTVNYARKCGLTLINIS